MNHPSFRQTLTQLQQAQKPGAGVPAYTRWVNRRLARYLAAAAVSLGLGPNGVTLLSALVSLSGMVLLMSQPPSWGLGLLVAFLYALGYALDSADGQVARVTGAASPAGEWLDHVVDSIRTPAMHLAILVAWIRFPDFWPLSGWQLWWLPMAFCLLVTGHFMSQILAEQLRAREGKSGPASGGALRSFLNLHMDAGTFCWLFLLWGGGLVFLLAYGLLFAASALTVLVSMRRKFSNLSQPGEVA